MDTSLNIRHEEGHSYQSRNFGPLYLIFVGIPSYLRNRWDYFFHGKWNYWKRDMWYYDNWPENQADELGGVKVSYITNSFGNLIGYERKDH
jgi:hypothetical protein